MAINRETRKLLEKHQHLIHSEGRKVTSHVQREIEDWILNILMIEGSEVPFKYKRKRRYKDLSGSLVNITYYPDVEYVAGMEFEIMKVVRIKIA